jgi:hypothetical protein
LPDDTVKPISPPASPNASAPKERRLSKDKFNLDFKTDHDVDLRKFMPADTQQQRLFDTTTPLNHTLPAKRMIPLLGLSVTRPLN